MVRGGYKQVARVSARHTLQRTKAADFKTFGSAVVIMLKLVYSQLALLVS
jgi:hypothetical protein